MQVKDLMTAKPSYCTPYWTVEAVAALMDHAGSGAVPVVEDLLNRKVVGIVTDRDLCVRTVAPGQYPAHTWVSACMTARPACCQPEDGIETALRLMRERRVRRLPVVDDQAELKGMISISDFIRSKDVETTLVYETLREICEPATGGKKPEAPLHSAA